MFTTDLIDETTVTMFLTEQVDGEPYEPMLDCITTRFCGPNVGDVTLDLEAFAAVFFGEGEPWAACFMAE